MSLNDQEKLNKKPEIVLVKADEIKTEIEKEPAAETVAGKEFSAKALEDKGKTPEEKLKLKHFIQSIGYCGPAALKILLSYFGKDFTEEQLALMAATTRDEGTEHEGLIEAIKAIDGYVFVKEEGTIEELEYFVKEEKLPIIIGWFDKDGDHYSVVANITDKNIIVVDPATDEPERWLDKSIFHRVWFDFVGKDNRTVSWGWYMVVNFQKKRYKVKGGHYY